MNFFVTALEAGKILVILLLGMIYNFGMLMKASPGESVEGFILSVLFFMLAFFFWYLADVVNFVLQGKDTGPIVLTFVCTLLGYISLLAGMADYFHLDIWWIGLSLVGVAALCWIFFKRMIDGLTERIHDGQPRE